MSDLGVKDSGVEHIRIINSFTVSDNEPSSLTRDSIVNQESGIKKGTLDDKLFKEAIVSTRRLDDMVILNGDIDDLPARFVYESIESESKSSRAYNCTIFQSYTNKIDYSTLERKLSLFNKQTEKQDLNQIQKVQLPSVEQFVIESKILELFGKCRETLTNSMNSTVDVERQNGQTFVRSRTTEKQNIKPKRKVSKTPIVPGIPRKRKIGQTGDTSRKLTKTPLLVPAIKPNELATDESNIIVDKSTSGQNNELGITKAATGLIIKKNFNSVSLTVSLAENISLIEQTLPVVETKETYSSESNILLPNVDITQYVQGRPSQVTTNEAKTKKSFSEINVTAAETNMLTTTENKNLSHRPENIDVLLQSNQSTEFSALIKQETCDAADKPETDHLLVIGGSSDLISKSGTEVSFVLHQDQYPSTECMASINQEKNDTESDHGLVTGERTGSLKKLETEQISFKNSSDQFSLTECEAMVKPEQNDTTSETNKLLVNSESTDKFVSPATEDILSETIEITSDIDLLLDANERIIIPDRIPEDILLEQEIHEATDKPETDHLLCIGESSDLISQPGSKVLFVLHQDQCPIPTECMASINQKTNDTESDHCLVTGERSGLLKRLETERISFENSSDQFSLTEFEAMVQPEANDITSETDDLLVNSESTDKFLSPATEDILSELIEDHSLIKSETFDITSDIDQMPVASESIIIPEDILLNNEEQMSSSTEIIDLINSENTDTTSETDRLLVTGESTDLFLGSQILKIATDAPEMDPLLIMTEVTDLTLSPESDQDSTTAGIITPLKPETKHLQANKTNNANALVQRKKKERLSNMNAVAKSKTSSGQKYTKLPTDIINMLSSNVKKLKMHIVKKPGDLFEILPLSFFRKNKKKIKKCKPLTITLIDYKVYAKMSKLYEYEVFNDILHLTKYVQQNYLKKGNTKTNVNKPKGVREQPLRGEYHKPKSTTRIEILDLASKMFEIYEFDGRSNIASFEKNKLLDDFDLEHFKAGIGLKEPTRAIACCWFSRRALVKLLCTKFGQQASFSFINKKHTCPFGKCKCCVQCQNENGESPSLPNKVKYDHTVKSLRKTTTLSIPSEPKTLIDKALAYAKTLSFKHRLSVISDNIVSSAQKQIQALSKPWLNNEIIEVRNHSSGIVEIYDVDSKGEVQTLTKERYIAYNLQFNLLLLGDIIDVSKKSNLYNACCWNKREQIIEKLKNLKVKSETLNFIRQKHMCPIDSCHCCCPYVQVINLKVVNNDTINELKKIKQTSSVSDQLEKNIQTNPLPNMSNNNENTTNISQNKNDNLMQSIIDEEISNLIKDSNSPLSTFYKVGIQKEPKHAFPKPGSSGLVKSPEKEVPVIEIVDDDENQSIANVLTNDTANVPGPPPLVQSQQPPIDEVNTIIAQILNRFQDLRLNIGKKGQVQAVLQNTLDNVSTLELSLLKQILLHAQSLVDKYKITSNANLSSMMGLAGKPQSQLYNEQAASRGAQSSVAPCNIPMASIPTEVPPAVRVQSNRLRLARPTLTQTPIIKNVYSCQPNSQPNTLSQDKTFYQPNSISRPIPIKNYVDSQQRNPMTNPVHDHQSFQPDPRIRTTAEHTISETAVGSNQPQTAAEPATALLSSLRTNLSKMINKSATPPQSLDDRLPALPRLAPKPFSELANLTLANMLSSNTYKKPNFQTNNINLERISAPVHDVSMATCSVGTTTVDLGNKTTKKRKKEDLQKSYEMLSRIQPVVLSKPPPLRPFPIKKVTCTNNALKNNPSKSGDSLITGMPFGNNSATLTHVISNTGAANLNPIPVLSNVVSLQENPIANVSVGEPKSFLERDPSIPNVDASYLNPYKNETTRSSDQNSSSTDSTTDSLKTDSGSSCVTVWYRKPQPKLLEELLDQTQDSSSKHKLSDENETQLEKKRKLSQDPPLDFPTTKTEIKEEDEDDIIFF